jgi:hypothetical protein
VAHAAHSAFFKVAHYRHFATASAAKRIDNLKALGERAS